MPTSMLSTKFEEALQRVNEFDTANRQDFADDSPAAVLNRSLSYRSAIPTDIEDDDGRQLYRSIGRGSFGEVFQKVGYPLVLKLVRHDSPQNAASERQVLNREAWTHDLIHRASEKFREQLQGFDPARTPSFLGYYEIDEPRTDAFWADIPKDAFPSIPVVEKALLAERIFPLPKQVRSALIQRFFPYAGNNRHDGDYPQDGEHSQDGEKPQGGGDDWGKRQQGIASTMLNPANRDCLIRLYLGRSTEARDNRPSRLITFTLRNFPLKLDQAVALGIPVAYYARMMAHSLALCHYVVCTDARDVEFVLGSAPTQVHRPDSMLLEKTNRMLGSYEASNDLLGTSLNSRRRECNLYLLDFNQCQDLELPADDSEEAKTRWIKQALSAIVTNDPYYPDPRTALGRIFGEAYVEAATYFLEHGDEKDHSAHVALPELLLVAWREHKDARDMTSAMSSMEV